MSLSENRLSTFPGHALELAANRCLSPRGDRFILWLKMGQEKDGWTKSEKSVCACSLGPGLQR